MARAPITITPQDLEDGEYEGWPRAEVEATLALLEANGGKVPRGRQRGIPTGMVTAIQRERLLAAVQRAAAEGGHAALSRGAILELAQTTNPTFYRHFADKEDCFVMALDRVGAVLERRLREAVCEAGDGERVRVALGALLGFAAEQPAAACTLIVAARAASPMARQRRDAMLERATAGLAMAAAADRARQDGPGAGGASTPGGDTDGERPGRGPSDGGGSRGGEDAAREAVLGVDAVLCARLGSGRWEGLEELADPLHAFVAAVLGDGGGDA